MAVHKINHCNEDQKNILSSLKYLANEAIIGGHAELFAILINALKLALKGDAEFQKFYEHVADNDSKKAVELMMKFTQSSKQTQLELITLLEYLESEPDNPLENHLISLKKAKFRPLDLA